MPEICSNMQVICRCMLKICKYSQWYARNMPEICKHIDCISQICKKYAVQICRNMQFYMQHMQKSIIIWLYCIFCIYMHSPLCWCRFTLSFKLTLIFDWAPGLLAGVRLGTCQRSWPACVVYSVWILRCQPVRLSDALADPGRLLCRGRYARTQRGPGDTRAAAGLGEAAS